MARAEDWIMLDRFLPPYDFFFSSLELTGDGDSS